MKATACNRPGTDWRPSVTSEISIFVLSASTKNSHGVDILVLQVEKIARCGRMNGVLWMLKTNSSNVDVMTK